MILLPLMCWLAWTVAFQRAGRTWLEASVASLVIFGLVASIATEGQSLARVLTPGGSAIAWLLATGVGLAVARRTEPTSTPTRERGPRPGIVEVAPVVLLLALTAAVALMTAPNSYDGLSYHLMRVESWIQQGSLAPFATNDTRQLFMPAGAEYGILQFRLLSGSDRFSNLVQWIGFAGCIGGAAVLAQALGGGRIAAAVAATLVATVPPAVAQASGTQTDVIAACWAVIAAALGYRLWRGPRDAWSIALTAIALGLAAATKQTALLAAGAALIPVGALMLARREHRRWAAMVAGAGVAAIAVLAGPQIARNQSVFGDPRGDPAIVREVVMAKRSPAAVAGNLLRNGAAHFGTPSTGVNEAVTGAVARISRAIGADPDDSATTWKPPFTAIPWTTHEQSVSATLHVLLLLACLFALFRWRTDAVSLAFLGSVVAGVVAFAVLFKWQFYIVRLQLPLLALALVWAAVQLERLPAAGRRALLVILTGASLPFALLNYTRPLITLPGNVVTPNPDILSVPRNLQYFFYAPPLGLAYWDVALRIARNGCTDIGVRAWPDTWLYPVVMIARRAGSAAHYRHLEVDNVSARYEQVSPPPCLLLQIGPLAAQRPAWAAGWRTAADYTEQLGERGIALYAPEE